MKSRRAYKKKKKRVGRGSGSGHGKTSCRGSKGQYSRSGSSVTPGFEGGQTPFYRRLPKRGFNQARFRKHIAIVNVDSLNNLGEKEVTPERLHELGVINHVEDGVKVLGNGVLDKAMTIHAHAFSQKAKAKIEGAGGKVVVIEKK